MEKYTFEDYVKVVGAIASYIPENVKHAHYPYGGSDIIWAKIFYNLIMVDKTPGMLEDGKKFEEKYKEDGIIPSSHEIQYFVGDATKLQIKPEKGTALIWKPGPDAALTLREFYKKRKEELQDFSIILFVEQSRDPSKPPIDEMEAFLKELGFHRINTEELDKLLDELRKREYDFNPEVSCGAYPAYIKIFSR